MTRAGFLLWALPNLRMTELMMRTKGIIAWKKESNKNWLKERKKTQLQERGGARGEDGDGGRGRERERQEGETNKQINR